MKNDHCKLNFVILFESLEHASISENFEYCKICSMATIRA